MTDQDQKNAKEKEEVAHKKEVDDRNIENNGTQEEKEETMANDFLVIRGHYRYGGRNKTYGIFELIGNKDSSKFSYVDLGSTSNNEVYNLFLDLNNQDFRDDLQQLVKIGSKQDKIISQKIRKELSVGEIVENLTGGREENLKEVIREKIEDELQEEIELELNWGFLNKLELGKIYPDRFKVDEEEGNEDLDNKEVDSLSDYKGDEDSGSLNIDLKLNCEPVISAISGKLISSFDIGDEMLVRITDQRELNKDLKDRIRVSNGLGVGTINKIDYKTEIDRYKVLVELGNEIYGQLVVGPKVMLSYPESKGNVISNDLKGESSQTNFDNGELGIIITIVGLFIVIIILVLLYL